MAIKHKCIGEIKGDLIVFTCTKCSHVRTWDWKKKIFTIVNMGDTEVFHSGNSEIAMGLEITSIEIKQKDYLKPFADFMEGANNAE